MTEIQTSSHIDVKLVQHMGGDDAIVAAARVSVQGIEATTYEDADRNKGLINYLMKNRHGTPFEHGSMTIFVHAPIFVFREWHRHRVGWSYNEESGRYKQLDPVFYVPDRWRPLAQEGKPGDYKYKLGSQEQHELTRKTLISSYQAAYSAYEKLLSAGITREVARMCLPVGIYSSMYATMNPRSLMHFLGLRTKVNTAKFVSTPMYEIERAAMEVEHFMADLWPITYRAFNEFGRVSP